MDKNKEDIEMKKELVPEFEKAYFLKTRDEIEVEKKSRDLMLNFTIVVLGGIAFSLVKNENSDAAITSESMLVAVTSALYLITILIWLRLQKLQQIADRWYVLNGIIDKYYTTEQEANIFLEKTVVDGLNGWGYVKKDIYLFLVLVIPMYVLMYFQVNVSWKNCEMEKAWSIILITALHFIISMSIICRKMKNRTAKGKT